MSQGYGALPSVQCIILVGGQGTRLGDTVRDIPKPMLDIMGKPFLIYLIRELARFGLTNFLLLAGYQADIIRDFFTAPDTGLPEGVSVTVLVEKEPMGTGGALREASNHLEPNFLLCNGDSICLFNLLRMTAPLKYSKSLARMALMPIGHNTRYGQVVVDAGLVTGFSERSGDSGPSVMNTGIYFMRREILDAISPGKSSLEVDVFPKLAAEGLLEAEQVSPRFFIDIGIPEDLERAKHAIPRALFRPAAFFDRDGVLNHDLGHVHTISDFHWVDGAKESILACNEAGYLVFVVTNQAGIAKGYYPESAMRALHAHMQAELRALGAHIDAFAFCPHHPEASVPEFRCICSCRKPAPGMILRLCEDWNVDLSASFMIGDKSTDLDAAAVAGISCDLFSGGNLLDTVSKRLRESKFGNFNDYH
jgi:D-glycero-D-manno-heptose 1,7-bisphosphate phosphatase